MHITRGQAFQHFSFLVWHADGRAQIDEETDDEREINEAN
jgi:hypothetical protein